MWTIKHTACALARFRCPLSCKSIQISHKSIKADKYYNKTNQTWIAWGKYRYNQWIFYIFPSKVDGLVSTLASFKMCWQLCSFIWLTHTFEFVSVCRAARWLVACGYACLKTIYNFFPLSLRFGLTFVVCGQHKRRLKLCEPIAIRFYSIFLDFSFLTRVCVRVT